MSSYPETGIVLLRLSLAVDRKPRNQEVVVNFVAVGAPSFNKFQQDSICGRKRFNQNKLRTTRFHKVQFGIDSGSGPGGRRFKSSRPDHSFSIRYGYGNNEKLAIWSWGR
jgi:hypothetical protein